MSLNLETIENVKCEDVSSSAALELPLKKRGRPSRADQMSGGASVASVDEPKMEVTATNVDMDAMEVDCKVI